MAKAKAPNSKTLPEAEARLRASLERLETIIKTQKAGKTEADRLRKENVKLEEDFQGLKKDYSSLEQSFRDLKDSVSKMSEVKKADKNSPELGDDLEGKANLDPENDFLKKELERVHSEYKKLDQSFRVLRSQYNELQKTYEDALEGGTDQGDMLLGKSHTPETKVQEEKPSAPESGMKDLKRDLGNQLDKTISALEKLVS